MPICKLVSTGKGSPKALIRYMQHPKIDRADSSAQYHGADPSRALSEEEITAIFKNVSGLSLSESEELAIAHPGTIPHDDPGNISREIVAHWKLNHYNHPEVERVYLHFIIAYCHIDSEKQSYGVFKSHLNLTMSDFLPNGQWTAALHQNRKHKHWHVAANIFDLNGNPLNTERVWLPLRRVSDEYAKGLGLHIVQEMPEINSENAMDNR